MRDKKACCIKCFKIWVQKQSYRIPSPPVRSVCIEVTLLAIIRMRNALKGLQPAPKSILHQIPKVLHGLFPILDPFNPRVSQWNHAKSSGSNRSQGYIISKPVSHQVVNQLLFGLPDLSNAAAPRAVLCGTWPSRWSFCLQQGRWGPNHCRSPYHGWYARESSKENGSGRDLDEDWYSLDLWSQCPGKKTSDFKCDKWVFGLPVQPSLMCFLLKLAYFSLFRYKDPEMLMSSARTQTTFLRKLSTLSPGTKA